VVVGALVSGGTATAGIDRHPRDRIRMAVREDGKEAITHYRLRERFRAHTALECRLETGRTHQIRVHTQHAGHPIAFDDRYGDREFDKQLAGTGLNRLFLHAAALKFTHPGTGETLRIEAPLDEQLKRCLKVLRG